MITNAAAALKTDLDPAKSSLNFPKDATRPEAAKTGSGKTPAAPSTAQSDCWAPDWNYASKTSLTAIRTEDLYMKYTSRDGDVLELRSQSHEEIHYDESVGLSGNAKALAAENAGAEDAEKTGEAEALTPKEKQLKELREWAKQVEREVRLQQQRILEQLLKQSGKHVDAGEGRFLIVQPPDANVDGAQADKDAENGEEPGIPDYWNAENTSDRIVHFATQMAEICGLDMKEFGETIKKAVGDGFDQANAATGELPGAAGKLNRDTRELVFSKLSKWLEEREDKLYNQGAQKKASITADVHDGIENHEQ
jgi:hypothetical protein